MFIGDPRRVDNSGIQTHEHEGRRTDHRVMRSGKAEYAVGAAGTAGISDRQVGGTLAGVQAELEARLKLFCLCLRREIKTAKRDQQALGGDGVGRDDAN